MKFPSFDLNSQIPLKKSCTGAGAYFGKLGEKSVFHLWLCQFLTVLLNSLSRAVV